MKKGVIVLVCSLFVAGNVFAAPRGTEEYKQMVEYKKAQREAKQHGAANPSPKAKGFWEKEGERSGLGNSGAGVSGFFAKLNPVPFLKDQDEKYKARKAGAAAK